MPRLIKLISMAATLSLLVTLLTASATLSVGPVQNYVAVLSGAAERLTPRDTPARGVAKFQLSADGTELSYILIASNIDNVVFAHIHAPAGVEGTASPVVFLLHDQPAGGGAQNGVLATGTITAGDLIGVFAGQPLSVLIDAIEDGLAYVNVHTNDGVAPTNTGPGDFPGGEIRGQIQ